MSFHEINDPFCGFIISADEPDELRESEMDRIRKLAANILHVDAVRVTVRPTSPGCFTILVPSDTRAELLAKLTDALKEELPPYVDAHVDWEDLFA